MSVDGNHFATPAELMVVRPGDLSWWLQKDTELKWRFASSMPQFPHSYVIRDKSIDEVDHVRGFGAVRTWGTPGKFNGRDQLYLNHPEIERRWWLMSRHHWQSGVINVATDGRTYGTQDAVGIEGLEEWSAYDAVGAFYDDCYRSTTKEEVTAFWRSVVGSVDGVPRALDLGAGTGGSIDSRALYSRETTVVDPSRGMLNDLVLKHPQVKQAFCLTAEQYVGAELGTVFDIVTASFGSASYFSPELVMELPRLAKTAVVLSFYVPGFLPLAYDVPGGLKADRSQYEFAFEAATSLPRTHVEERGNYINVTIEGKARGH